MYSDPGVTLPGGPSDVYGFINGSSGGPMCGLGWKSLGVLELTALPSIKEEHSVPAVQDVDALLVWGGSPLYLCYWMRHSGLADLLPSLHPGHGLRRHERRRHGRDSRLRRSDLRRQ